MQKRFILFLAFVVLAAILFTAAAFADDVVPVPNTFYASLLKANSSSSGNFSYLKMENLLSDPVVVYSGKFVNNDKVLFHTGASSSNLYYVCFMCEGNMKIEVTNSAGSEKLSFPQNTIVPIIPGYKYYFKYTGTTYEGELRIRIGMFMLPIELNYEIESPDISDMLDSQYSLAFSSGLEEGYNTGYAQGEESGYLTGFEEGQEYGYVNGFYTGGDVGYTSGVSQGEELGFTNGYAAGGDNYKLTSEYEAALAESWNAGRSNGYKAGYDDKSSEFNPLALVISLLTVCELALVITVIVKKIRRRKRT